jgi:hypothetical protein
MTKEQLVLAVEDLLRTIPSRGTIRHAMPENFDWMARATTLLQLWKEPTGKEAKKLVDTIYTSLDAFSVDALNRLLTVLHQMKHELLIETIGPMNLVLSHGMVFDYFDEIRKLIETAEEDLLFVDPYLDAEFVSKYLPHAAAGTRVRLLAREKVSALIPAVDSFVQQHKRAVGIRSAPNFHDRYVFIDRTSCYQSGASFKDGARKAPTTLTQITDAFTAMLATYEDLWNRAKVER